MKFIDLFAGIGGFHYALKSIEKSAKPVMVSEIDKYAKEAYAYNHKFSINDIRNIRDYTSDTKESKKLLNSVEPFDILMGGFPCQTFSNAGKKMGFLDKTRGTLFFDVAKIIKDKKPKYVLLENVKHLATHDEGKTWDTIKSTLKNLGYLVPEQPPLLSPHEFGIPQIRWRVFIPAIRADLSNKKVLNFNFEDLKTSKIKKMNFDKKINKKTIVEDKKILDALEAWGEFIKKVKRPVGRTLPVIWLDHMNPISYSEVKGINNMSQWKRKYIKDMKNVYKNNKEFIDSWMNKHNVKSWQKRERKLEWQAGAENFDSKNSYVQLRQSGFRFKKEGVFPTLVAMVQTSLFFDKTLKKWRYLSKDEVRRLQSFPASFKFNVKDYQTYKQFGNSVNVAVVKIVLKKLLTY